MISGDPEDVVTLGIGWSYVTPWSGHLLCFWWMSSECNGYDLHWL